MTSERANSSTLLGKEENPFLTTTATASFTDCSSETLEKKITKRQKKKAKRSGVGIGTPSKLNKFEIFTTENVNVISEAIHLKVIESKVRYFFLSVFSK